MQELNLAYFQSKKVDDFFVAVLKRPMSKCEMKSYLRKHNPDEDNIERLNAIIASIEEQSGESLPEEDKAIICSAEKFYKFDTTIVLKDGEAYVDMSCRKVLNMRVSYLICMEPLTKYYDNSEVSFKQVGNEVIMKFSDYGFKMGPYDRKFKKLIK